MSNWNRDINQAGYDGVKPFVQEAERAYRPPTYKWTVPYEEWRDDAACSGMPTNQFTLDEEASEDEQHESIAKGLRICVACPVRQACKSNSTEEDRFWTIRGGQPPEGLFLGMRNLKDIAPVRKVTGLKVGGPGRVPLKQCKRGHEDWAYHRNGQRYCKPCKELNNRRRYKKS